MSFSAKNNLITEHHIFRLLNIFRRIHKGSVWSRVMRADFIAMRFENGFVNDICACILTQGAVSRLRPRPDDFRGVVVKIFPKSYFYPIDVVHRGVIYTAVADSGLGPRLLYIDSDCCVIEYIHSSRPPTDDDHEEPGFSENIMRMLARYHCLDIPVSDNFPSCWITVIDSFQNNFPGVKDLYSGDIFRIFDSDPQFKGYREVFQKIKIKNTFEYFIKAMRRIQSPIVFSHMDFHRLNQIVRLKEDGSKELFILDLDVTMYAYRGFDLGAFFVNFLQKKALFKADPFPTDEQIVPLIEAYRDECSKIRGETYLKLDENSIARILREIKLFALYYYFIDVFFCLIVFSQDPKNSSSIEFIHRAYIKQLSAVKFRRELELHGILPNVGIFF